MEQEKKQNSEISGAYDPKSVEDKIYAIWEKDGYFAPEAHQSQADNPNKNKTFTITIPPPNITGSLHMGHALNAAIQDILIRKKRMEGYKTLWLPGTDHAGIATQNVVEKELKKEGLNRHDIGKEKLLERIWEWKEKYGNKILEQLKKIGASCDFTRTRFTMDNGYQQAVKEAFLHYYKAGLIYKAERVINWCKRCETSLSDLELEYKEEKTKLWYIKYHISKNPAQIPTASVAEQNGNPKQIRNSESKIQDYIIVATTRPETMLGDTAVAVNPKDERYKNLIGKKAVLPIINKEIPVIADKSVDMNFGTGAVKVTPAHSIIDAEIGRRHNLETVKVIGEDGKFKENSIICNGLNVIDCRTKVLNELQSNNLLSKEEDYIHNLALCYRCGTIVENIPSKQWFLKMDKLAKRASQTVKSGKTKFHPKKWEKTYFNWLSNIRDWCISRQIWWGHQIPVWYCVNCDAIKINPKIKTRLFFVRHGETDWNKEGKLQGQSEIPLNEFGKEQAKKAAEKLINEKIDLIISSDLTRCKETSEIIKEKLKCELIFDPRLRERHGGIYHGTTVEQRTEINSKNNINKEQYDSIDFKFPEGESYEDVEKRILEALKEHKKNHKHKNIVVVTHSGPIRMIRKNLDNAPFGEIIKWRAENAEILKYTISDKCVKCENGVIKQDPDVLDTWFSSALWPFATLGWPKKTKDLKNYYPTQILSTDRDIIPLWVARMIFSGLEFMKKEPFRDVIIHATVLTKEGKRMSKSLGTGIDPMDLIEKYGADATRFGLMWQAMGGQDIHWSEEHVLAGKKFANKIWNASRFVLQQIDKSENQKIEIKSKFQIPNSKNLTKEDKKIIKELNNTIQFANKHLEKYEFGQVLHKFYDFFWHEFCDKYLEISKKQLENEKTRSNTEKVLLHTLQTSLKLLHPFMPFITEEIWSRIPIKNKKLLIIEEWPK